MRYLKLVTKVLVISTLFISSFAFFSTKIEAEKFNMSYLYFGRTDTFISQVQKTNSSLNTVAPSYFDLFVDGTLDEKVDPLFVEEMHKMNIKVVPFLSNHWDREKGRLALQNREKLVNDIVEAINKYNLDGVNVDLENLTDVDRDNYTDLVRLLREKLGEEKEVSVAVAANPNNWTKGWHGSYDYTELAKYSDYLMVMTYDESYYGSQAGPVASIDFVEKSIQYAIDKAPADKIVLGVPFYGRYWRIGDATGGRGISQYRVNELVEQFNGKIYFDEKSKSPYAIVTIPYGYAPKVHGRSLKSGNYVIWFENDASLKIKLKLVEKYNLQGTGSWSLNEAPSDIWSYYTAWLNGKHYFVDAENHWAESDILTMLNKGWMVGATSDYFTPDNALTRAQGAAVLVRALGLRLDNSMDLSSEFVDTTGHWAEEVIEIAYQHGLVEGVGEGKFAPNKSLTREEMAVLLSRIFKLQEEEKAAEIINPFPDVETEHWATKDILTLNERNVFNGFEDGTFRPKTALTRAQMAALMNRLTDDLATLQAE